MKTSSPLPYRQLSGLSEKLITGLLLLVAAQGFSTSSVRAWLPRCLTVKCPFSTSNPIVASATPGQGVPQSGAADASRRIFLSSTVAVSGLLTVPSRTDAADAKRGSEQMKLVEVVGEQQPGLVSAQTIVDLLRVVPTFCIVDKEGVPFMVVGEDAKVTGYFFTTFDEAQRLLTLARTSVDKSIADAKNDPSQDQAAVAELTNPWVKARISSVPMDFAVTLVTKSMYGARRAGGNYFQIAPADADVEDALAINGKTDLAEGKVPLFYYPDFSINENDGKQSPLYFRQSELERAFRKQNPGQDLPKTAVTELFAVLAAMVEPGGTDLDLQTLVFIPPRESVQKAKACDKKNGKNGPYFVGKRNLVL
jgi:hypothetical protein